MNFLAKLPDQKSIRWLILPLAVLSFLSPVSYIGLEVAGCDVVLPYSESTFIVIGLAVGTFGFAVLGSLLLLKRPSNRIGWLTAGVGFCQILPLLRTYNECGLNGQAALPGLPHTVWLDAVIGPIFGYLVLVILPMIFPTGQFISKFWRRITWFVLAAIVTMTLVGSLLPGGLEGVVPGIARSPENPLALAFLPVQPIQRLGNFSDVLFSIMILLSIATQAYRLRNSGGDERQQLKWFAYFVSTVVLFHVIVLEVLADTFYPWIWETPWYGLSVVMIFAGLPLTIGIAIFKYRLYDIDFLIRRTLLYASLTGLLGLVYFGAVVAMQSIFRALTGSTNSQIVTVVSTLVIVALFNPLRHRIQGFIDRRFYRVEYDAQQMLARFAAATQSEVNLHRLSDELLTVVNKTVRPKQLGLWLDKGTRP